MVSPACHTFSLCAIPRPGNCSYETHERSSIKMVKGAPLTIGHIPYLNCVPFFHYLREAGCTGKLKSGVPSALNSMLQQAELDVSPSSSFEYARNWQDYLIIPNHSISSTGPVQSVLFFSPVSLECLSGKKIIITGDSATSINLLRIIMFEFIGVDQIADEVAHGDIEKMLASGMPTLLIGDRALKATQSAPRYMHCFDLGELWHRHTGLPFVFALWMARKEAVSRHNEEIEKLGGQLSVARKHFFSEIEALANNVCQGSCLSQQGKIKYWKGIEYDLGAKHIEGMDLFFQLCVKHGLLRNRPQINFVQSR